MQFGPRPTSKPPVGAQIDRGHPWVGPAAMRSFYALNEGYGTSVADSLRSLNLSATGWAASPWSAGAATALACSTNSAIAYAVLPASLQLGFPITLTVGFRNVQAASAYGELLSLYTNSTGASPYDAAGLYKNNNSNTLRLAWASGSTSEAALTSTTLANGLDYVVAVTYTSTGQYLYLNGNLVYSSSVATANPTYGGSPILGLGNFKPSSSGANPGVLIYWASVWNSALPASMHGAIGASVNSIWQIFEPASKVAIFGAAPTPTPTPTLSIDPSYATRARATTAVSAGAGTTIVNARPGRLVQVLVTSTGTGSGGVVFYDSVSGASGTVVGYLPATAVAGTLYPFDVPVGLGLVCSIPANGPALTVAWR